MKTQGGHKASIERTFESPILEQFTRSDPRVSALLWVSIGCALLFEAHAFIASDPLPAILIAASTVILWTFLEYWVHRFFFHFEPKTELGCKILYVIHEHHHVYPDQPHRNMLPLTVTIPVGLLLLIVAMSVAEYALACLFLGTFALSYISYDTLHYLSHRRSPWLPFNLRRHHMLHHHFSPAVNFGILTSFWDRVFGTRKGGAD